MDAADKYKFLRQQFLNFNFYFEYPMCNIVNEYQTSKYFISTEHSSININERYKMLSYEIFLRIARLMVYFCPEATADHLFNYIKFKDQDFFILSDNVINYGTCKSIIQIIKPKEQQYVTRSKGHVINKPFTKVRIVESIVVNVENENK